MSQLSGGSHGQPQGPGKVMPLSEAIRRFVRPRMVVHAAYAHARPNAALLEIARQFLGKDPNFVLVTPGLVSTQNVWVHARLARRIVTAYAGENYPAPRPSPVVRRALESGELDIENWSLFTWCARLQAAACGLPFFPTRSLRGSGMAAEHAGDHYVELNDPFGGGERIGIVSPLRPDITVLQGVAADHDGNVVLSAPLGEGPWGALASTGGVIACVERIVEPREIRAHSTFVRIPSHKVRAVCHVPFGSHPYGLFNPGFGSVGDYGEDRSFMRDVSTAMEAREDFEDWIQEWVTGTASHAEYLEKVTQSDNPAEALRRRLRSDTIESAGEASWERAANDFTPRESMVVGAARVAMQAARGTGVATILAGVGLASLAAWSTREQLASAGLGISLLSEIGMYGYEPQPGDPFVFSLKNILASPSLVDVATILGGVVDGGSDGCLAIIGAGIIDPQGNIGSTWDNDGHFMVGSGGANDVSMSASGVIAMSTHSARRLVASVDYITSPGTNVRALVTDLGIFERDRDHSAAFVLTSVHDVPNVPTVDIVEQVRARTGWHPIVSRDLRRDVRPSASELSLIRSFDPHRELLNN